VNPLPSNATSERPNNPSRVAWTLRAARVRLRFVLILLAAGLVIGGWDTLRNYWDRWVIPAGRDPYLGAVSGDTEYFCPMDPGVLSSWSGKCSVCNMSLVRRSKGDMTPLPNGVVARVHLTPNRLQLGGIRTSPVGFASLNQTVALVGVVTAESDGLAVIAAAEGLDRTIVTHDAKATVIGDPPDGREALSARVERIEPDGLGAERLVVMLQNAPSTYRPGDRAHIEISSPIANREPFRSLPDEVPVLKPGEPRALFVCDEHPEVVRLEEGSCPNDGNRLMRRPLAADQRLKWWCPMHPKVTSITSGEACKECEGMLLQPRVMTYRPKGKVLAVPESAVIDTGTKQVVYIESMPGTFDAVEVKLGPRCGTMYPVVSGLEPGQNVATAGAFLIDAETRLNPALSAGYFGASRPTIDAIPKPSPKLDFAGLSTSDRELAIAQKICPVTKKPLGSMGSPIKMSVAGRSVFVCCDGCIETLNAKPSRYLTPGQGQPPAHHP
jgi:hypothetical protein